MKNKGFLLLETLVVSSFVIGTLIFLFVQFSNLKSNYEDSFKYNTVPGLYGVKNINKFISNHKKVNPITYETEMKSILIEELYIMLYDGNICNSTYVSNIDYCNQLMSDLNVKTVLVTNEDITEFEDLLENENFLSEGIYQFIKKITIKYNDEYRIIVEFDDNTYSTMETNLS